MASRHTQLMAQLKVDMDFVLILTNSLRAPVGNSKTASTSPVSDFGMGEKNFQQHLPAGIKLLNHQDSVIRSNDRPGPFQFLSCVS